MIFNDKPLKYLTSAELEEAVRRHREQTKKLLAEVRRRRVELAQSANMQSEKKPAD